MYNAKKINTGNNSLFVHIFHWKSHSLYTKRPKMFRIVRIIKHPNYSVQSWSNFQIQNARDIRSSRANTAKCNEVCGVLRHAATAAREKWQWMEVLGQCSGSTWMLEKESKNMQNVHLCDKVHTSLLCSLLVGISTYVHRYIKPYKCVVGT